MFAVTEFFRPEDEQNWIKVFEEKEEAFAYAREQAKEAYHMRKKLANCLIRMMRR